MTFNQHCAKPDIFEPTQGLGEIFLKLSWNLLVLIKKSVMIRVDVFLVHYILVLPARVCVSVLFGFKLKLILLALFWPSEWNQVTTFFRQLIYHPLPVYNYFLKVKNFDIVLFVKLLKNDAILEHIANLI